MTRPTGRSATEDRKHVRLHGCTLYASLFRYDDEIIVNPHAWGQPALANPVMHLRRLDGGTVTGHCIDSFERV